MKNLTRNGQNISEYFSKECLKVLGNNEKDARKSPWEKRGKQKGKNVEKINFYYVTCIVGI